jgi:hypothetical protein
MRYVSNRYRPELHYMRGPGPKWLEKHAGQSGAIGDPERGSLRDRHAYPPHRADLAAMASGQVAPRSSDQPRDPVGPGRSARAVVGVAG